MKRIFLILLVLCAARSAAAQDLIVKTDEVQIEAKVLEITPEEVRYKRFSNPGGPTYVLPVENIRYIRYMNGEQEEFSAPAPAVPAAPAAPETSAAPQPAPAAPEQPSAPAPEYGQTTYAVGDYYERGAVRGVVCSVEEGGRHGLVLSLGETTTNWDTFKKPDFRATGALDQHDGGKNMETIARYIEANGLSWSDFPAFEWCRALGEGWYLPAINEWLTIAFNFNGNDRTTFNRQARNRMNDALKAHGGRKLDRMLYYFSSTEQDARMALTGHMAVEPPYVVPLAKSGITYLVRAVHKF